MRSFLMALTLLIASRSFAGSMPQDRPCIGLALSGGGALGLAHIGVLKVLEQEGIPIDVVSGTSMGSVIGALYAIGYTSEEIEKIALSTDWMDLFSDRLPRTELAMKSRKKEARYLLFFPVSEGRVRLPAGLIGGQKIYDLFVTLSWPALEIEDFRAFARPFACVATDIEKGEAVVFDRGYLPDALRASMAIPSVFAPIRIGGRLLADGGIVRNLPAGDARMLGADLVIGVDVAAELEPAGELASLLEILGRSFEIARRPEALRQRELCTVIIEPRLASFRTIDYMRAAEIIRAGEEATRSSLSAIRTAIDSARASKRGDSSRNQPETIERIKPPLSLRADSPVSVAEIEVRGLRDVSERFAMAELDLRAPRNITARELERAVRRLLGSGYFNSIRYKFEKGPSGRKLVVIVEEVGNISLNAGLRYDSHWGASLLLDAAAKNVLEHGSQLELELLLGDRKHAASEYAIHTGIRKSFGARLDVEWNEDHIDEYIGLDRRSRWKVSSLRSGFYLESFLSRVLYAAAGLNSEWFAISPEIAPAGASEIKDNMLFFRADLWIDTLDRLWFTRKGTMIRLRSEAGLPHSGNRSFERSLCLARIAVPVHKKLTLRSDFFAGTSSGAESPLHFRYFLGGENSWIVFDGERNLDFYGYEHQEFQGRHALFAGISLQAELARGLYIELASSAGNATEERKDLFDRSLIHAGYAAGLGVETPAGPVEIVLSYSERRKFGLFLDAGFPF